jgi:hypothetical protein
MVDTVTTGTLELHTENPERPYIPTAMCPGGMHGVHKVVPNTSCSIVPKSDP